MITGLIFAQNNQINLLPAGNSIGANAGSFTPARIVSAIVTFVLVIAALVFFFMLLWGGLQWILAGGDKGKTEEARNRITGALIGLVIVFSAWAILNLAASFLGVNFNNLTIPNI
jgi:Type IV secretion system pilin